MNGLAAGQFRRSTPAGPGGDLHRRFTARGRRATSPSNFLRCRRPILPATPQAAAKPVKKAQPWQSGAFPSSASRSALAGVVIALSLALQTVSGIVAEREGPPARGRAQRRRQPGVGADARRPGDRARLQRGVGSDPGRGQGQEDRDRAAPLQAERDAGDARRQGRRRHRAALPRHLQGQRLRAEGAPGRGLERRRDAGAARRSTRLAPALRRAGDVRRPRRLARRAQRGDADRRRRRAGARRHAARVASARLPRRRRRVVRRRAPAAARRGRRRAGRHRRARVRAGRRQHPRRARVGLAAPVVRRPLPADRAPGRRDRLHAPAGSSTRWRRPRRRRRRAARRRAASTTAASTRCRRARTAGARPASRPSASPSWTR